MNSEEELTAKDKEDNDFAKQVLEAKIEELKRLKKDVKNLKNPLPTIIELKYEEKFIS